MGGGEGARTEEHVLEDYGSLREAAEVGTAAAGGVGVGDRVPLDASPRKVDIEQQEEDAEADDGGLAHSYPR